ncbi:FAD-dependent oxidoreductase [Cystobacter fuscus]
MMAASVLSRHLDRVTVLERDRLPEGPEARKGVPQAHRAHALMARGANIMEELYPGLLQELVREGGTVAEMGPDFAYYHRGTWKMRSPTGLRVHSQSRRLLEWKLRERMKALPNVRVLEGCDLQGFVSTSDQTRIVGVRYRTRDAQGAEHEEELTLGDLVVDATGRGSRTPRWLEAMGYPPVEETRVEVDVGYATRLYKGLRIPHDWKVLGVTPGSPEYKRFGGVVAIENGQYLAMLGGWMHEHPPGDEAGFLEFARSLPRPEVYDAIKDAEAAGPIQLYKFPANEWHHYERMKRLPEGLVVLGDAFATFNPIYGQGMTTCGLQSLALGECLTELGRGRLQGLTERYHKRVAGLLKGAWLLAVSEDLRFPEVMGERPPGSKLMNWYGDRLSALASKDAFVFKTFSNMMHMLSSPATALDPRILMKVLLHREYRRGGGADPLPLRDC